jgi:hypothetical protein
MVDQEQIKRLLDEYFVIKGKIEIDDEGTVNVIDVPGVSPRVQVWLKKFLDDGAIPVVFGKVEGDFLAAGRNVKTLRGFPKFIKGSLRTEANLNLRQLYDCEIEEIGDTWFSSYRQSQGLLRMLVAKHIYLVDGPPKVESIMSRYAGQGRQGSLACAAELARAGYKGNARW